MIVRLNNTNRASNTEQGATLVELIITIVIISIALTGIMSVIDLTVRHSADPMIQRQAIAIAESYLEEILLLPVTDPDGVNTGETRATFDNMADYDALSDSGAADQTGTAITGLESYTIAVSVQPSIGQPPISINGVNMVQVTVNVSRPSTDTINLIGYKAI